MSVWLGQALHAHSQFCLSGDNTLEAAKHAIESVVKEQADEHFVIVLSDANLERYGIRPKRLAEILTMNDVVNAYVIFIGSLGDQAQRSAQAILYHVRNWKHLMDICGTALCLMQVHC